MKLQDALSTFGIAAPLSAKETKNLYRKLAKANHPDAGGDVKKMQEINAAYEVLSNFVAREASNTEKLNNYKKDRNNTKEMLSIIGGTLFSMIDIEAITERLNAIFNDSFSVIKDDYTGCSYIYTRRILWRSKDNLKAMKLTLSLSSTSILTMGEKLANEDSLDLPIISTLDLYADGRDIKLAKRRCQPHSAKSDIFDIDILLPVEKVRKAHKKNQQRKVKRIDSVMFLALCAGFKQLDSSSFQMRKEKEGFILQATRISTLGGGYSGSTFAYSQNMRSFECSLPMFYENEAFFTTEMLTLISSYQFCNSIDEVKGISEQVKALTQSIINSDDAAA